MGNREPCTCPTFFCEHYGRHLQWIPVYRLRTLLIWGFWLVIVFYLLSALNWAPPWIRLYSACMSQQPEANTLSDIFRDRVECAKFTTRAIRKQP